MVEWVIVDKDTPYYLYLCDPDWAGSALGIVVTSGANKSLLIAVN